MLLHFIDGIEEAESLTLSSSVGVVLDDAMSTASESRVNYLYYLKTFVLLCIYQS